MPEDKRKERDHLFDTKEEQMQNRILHEEKASGRYSTLRSVCFLCAVAAFFALRYLGNLAGAIILSSVFLLLFIFFVVRHRFVLKRIQILQNRLLVLSEYRARTQNDFTLLQDTGSDFISVDHDFSSDLDLFGARSLFNLLSTAKTWYGRRIFAEYLLSGSQITDVRSCLRRQEAVKEISGNLDYLLDLQAAGKRSRRAAEDPSKLLSYIRYRDDAKSEIGTLYTAFSVLSSAGFLLSIVAGLFLSIIPAYVPGIFLVTQLLLMAGKYAAFKPIFSSVSLYSAQLRAYEDMFRIEEEMSYSASLLRENQMNLKHQNGEQIVPASASIRSLHRISVAVQSRSQPILFFLLNLFLPYDVFCVRALVRWKKSYGAVLESALQALGTSEALMSLATMSVLYPECNFPEFVEDPHGVCFEAHGIGHPLIPADRRIQNDFAIRSGVALITGSNMSGKTTLLRTVGINAVLAYAGSVCCAADLQLTPMNILTSMRIADNLGEGLSTFYAELIRIGRMVERAKEGEPCLFLIDEIFRGTNSRDRTDGAKIVLQNLSKDYIIGLMSTHDYELCSLEDIDAFRVRNYHFSENYDADGIHFDYRLKPGISKTTNARYLMRLIGIDYA